MNHKCVKMNRYDNVRIYSPEDSNHWIISIELDCHYFTHTSNYEIITCPFCGVKL
jgi:hypothetical protein